jgi:cell division protein FtsQ
VSPRTSAVAAREADESTPTPTPNPRRTNWRRRRAGNRKIVVKPTPVLLAIVGGVKALAHGLLVVCRVTAKVLVLASLVAALLVGGRLAARHVMASPRFALREVEVTPTTRISREEILERAAVGEGDRLLALDTDVIARRVAEHPWIAEARVNRELPSGLRIEVVERKAAAVVALGALYLIDEAGRPFKRATMEEAEGLPVITGLERALYVDERVAGEAAFREALGLCTAWQARGDRPAISEVNIETRHGFTVFLLDGGAEIRLGRGDYERKLASFDRILAAVKASGAGAAALRVVHLDGANPKHVPVRMSSPTLAAVPAGGALAALGHGPHGLKRQ